MVNFFEKKNNAETTLSQGINSSITTIKVADASSFPTSGNFIVTIWNKTSYPDPSDDSSMEIVKVTNVSGNTFTVVRGQESTSAHSHSSGHAVELLITVGQITEIEGAINNHLSDTNNPHEVSKSDVGLSNVPNLDTTDAVANEHTHSNKSELDLITDGDHDVRTDNPHLVTKTQVGLSNVPNLDTTDAINKAHDQNSDTILDEGGANETSAAEIRGHIDDTNNPHSVDKTDVGLGNVDNVQQMPLSYLDTDDTLSADSDEKVSSQKAIKAYVDNVSGSSDTLKNLLLNIALLAFKLAVQSSLTIFKMIDGFMDEYEDASGIDAASSTNESYNSSDDYYSPSSALDSNSKLALNLDGSDSATSTTDESPSAHSVTFNGTAQLDTAEKKYGTASLLLDGNSDYLTLSDSSDWDICAVTTETWTVHCFIKTSGASGYIFSHTNGSDLWGLRLSSSKLTFFATSGGPDVINAQGTSNIADNAWHHVALVKIGGATPHWALYVDGTQEAYVEDTSTSNYTGTLYIGQSGFSSSYWGGWLDVIHIYKGNYFGANPNVGLSDTITPPSGVLGGVNNMTLISEAVVSDITPDTARIVIFEEDVDSVTLNTDLLAYISRDDGANYTQITLSAEETYSGSARVLSGVADISGQPSDTDVVYKIVTANNKNCRIHGTGIFWS